MAKTSKKALGAAMAGVMAVGAVAGAVNALDQVKVADAAESQALKDAKAKISHLTWSLKNNYLGLKNQGQWEEYVGQARKLIAVIPSAEKAQADALTVEVDKDQELINALARINQVEKSMADNHPGIKNAKQWTEYLNAATESLKSVDQKVFADQYAELVQRKTDAQTALDKVIKEFNEAYDKAVKLYNDAKESMLLDDAKKALAAAEALGTCDESDALEAKCKALISQIEKVEVEVKTVSIDEKTYDDKTKDQRLAIKINGENMNIDFLKGAGYKVEFVQTDSPSSSAKDLFVDGTTSNNGKLSDSLTTGDYKVQVTVSKDGNIAVSDEATIKVKNLNTTANTISSVNLLNDTGDFKQATEKLAVGDAVKIRDIEVSNGSTKTKITDLTDVQIETSNKGVISVDKTNKTFTAVSLGTAKVTISYGKVEKVLNFTVEGSQREVKKVAPKSSSVTVLEGKDEDVTITITDQYGDPISDPSVVKVESTNSDFDITGGIVAKSADDTEKGIFKINVKSGSTESGDRGSLLFKNDDGDLLGQVSLSVGKDTGVSNKKLEIVTSSDKKYSDDATIMVNTDSNNTDDTVLKVGVKEYTSNNVFRGYMDLTTATVKYDESLLKVEKIDGGEKLSITNADNNTKAGSSNVVITKDGKTYSINVTLKKEDNAKISSITWTNFTANQGTKVSALDVLNIDDRVNGDPELKSISLSSSTPHKVRIDSTGIIYLDKDDNRGYDPAKDYDLGKLVVKTNATKGSISTANNPMNDITVSEDAEGTVIYSVYVDDKDKTSNDGIDGSKYDKMISSKSLVIEKK